MARRARRRPGALAGTRRPERASEVDGAPRPKGRQHAAAVFLVCLVAYLGNCRTLPLDRGGDTIPNRLIPFALLAGGTPALDVFRTDLAPLQARWYVRERRGDLVSFYPIGTGLAALPVYAPIYGFLALGGRPPPATLFLVSQQAEKLAAATLTAAAVLVFFLTARRRLAARQAFWAALAFGLATSMWATASQMLWQQTAVAASLTVALWLLTWPELPPWAAAAAGAALSLALASRPTAALLLVAGLAATLWLPGSRQLRLRRIAAFALGAAPLSLAGLGVNRYYWDHWSGGYGMIAGNYREALTPERLQGIAGLLISPNRGLLVFTPIALLGIWGLLRQAAPPEPRDRVLIPFGVAAAGHLAVAGTYYQWWGGWSFGPRYLVDVLPVLALAAVTAWSRIGRWPRRAAALAIAWSFWVQVNGAFFYPASNWNGRTGEDPAAASWDWTELELWQDYQAWRAAGRWATPW